MGLILFVIVSMAISIGIIWAVNNEFQDAAVNAVVAIILVAIVGGFTAWNWATVYKNDRWVTCTVTSKDRGGSEGSYRVYTSDCGQLSNEDSWLRGKFGSADLWEQIPASGPVRLHVAGIRFRPFSQFPNIFEVEPVKATANN